MTRKLTRMAALSTTFEPALLKRVKNFSFRGASGGPWEILLADVPPYAARRRFARTLPVRGGRERGGVYPLLPTRNV